ncbi:hypothetical protein HdyHp2_085 [Haloarcula virus Hardyhisp2]|uniref:Uncharacterized protein n=1 Tax=Haloarcula virus Hardyhisp2 TaxID=2811386 RepID=A0A898KB77_9VIRU|nr:hypothetical protein QIT44_gp17 [Haloarcula virus Hardyhisp2]QSJ05037.1 hypothetical protein HdyHp2_085 [Haloarcula virus Hardyhisp2]
MPDLPLEKLFESKTVLVDGELYKLIGDYSDVQTKFDYEFQHIKNNNDTFMVSHNDLVTKFNNDWKVVEL